MLLGDLVDLIDIDDALLRLVHIIACGSEQLAHNAFDVITDITGFGQRGRIRDRKRNIQDLCQRLYQVGLTTARGTEHQHIGLLDLDLIHGIGRNPLVVVVDRNAHDLLGFFLSDHILIQHRLDLVRRRDIFQFDQRLVLAFFLLFHLLAAAEAEIKRQIRKVDKAHFRDTVSRLLRLVFFFRFIRLVLLQLPGIIRSGTRFFFHCSFTVFCRLLSAFVCHIRMKHPRIHLHGRRVIHTHHL